MNETRIAKPITAGKSSDWIELDHIGPHAGPNKYGFGQYRAVQQITQGQQDGHRRDEGVERA